MNKLKNIFICLFLGMIIISNLNLEYIYALDEEPLLGDSSILTIDYIDMDMGKHIYKSVTFSKEKTEANGKVIIGGTVLIGVIGILIMLNQKYKK